MKRAKSFKERTTPLIPRDDTDYLVTQNQEDVDDSPPVSANLELKDVDNDEEEKNGEFRSFQPGDQFNAGVTAINGDPGENNSIQEEATKVLKVEAGRYFDSSDGDFQFMLNN